MMDLMTLNQTSMAEMSSASQRCPENLENQDESIDNLSPIFPSPNFEVPDISFSNSVSPKTDFNQTLINSDQMYRDDSSLCMYVSTRPQHSLGEQPREVNQRQSQTERNVLEHEMTRNSQLQVTYFPSSSTSSPGTPRPDGNDSFPLSQLASRTLVCKTGQSVGRKSSSVSSSAFSSGTSLQDSPAPGATPKKTKPSKRKKRKDPNEPQKPVSAYALFFRDSQASIKGHSPTASFGEVSKIVASMWDQLKPDHKDVYKKKTEMAKKQYLKQLAGYRASQVSQSALESAKKTPFSPGLGSISPGSMPGSAGVNFQILGARPSSAPCLPISTTGQMLSQQPPSQVLLMPPHMLQDQHQMHNQLQLQQIGMDRTSSSSPSHQEHSEPQQQQTCLAGLLYSCPFVGQSSRTIYHPIMTDQSSFGLSGSRENMDTTYSQCVHVGYEGHTSGNPSWESDCNSNDCVLGHCRDTLTNWVAPRIASNTFPVK